MDRAAGAGGRCPQHRSGPQAQVWFAEDHTVPVVAFTISLPGGSAHDPAGKPGLAYIAAMMLDEGAGEMNSAAFQRALEARAIRLSARADRDYTVISVTALPEHAAEAMRLLQLALTRPRFDNDALTRVRASIIQSLEQDAAEPAQVASRAFMRGFFNGHPYGHAVNGDIASLKSITAADLRAFAKAHWVKNGIKIAASGDITQAAVTRLLGTTFAPLPGHGRAAGAQCGTAGPARRACDAVAGAAAHYRVRPAGHHAFRSRFHSRLCRQLHPGRRRLCRRA